MFCKRTLSLLSFLILSCSSSSTLLHTLKSLTVIPHPIHQPLSFNLHTLTHGDLIITYPRLLSYQQALLVGYKTFISEPLISCSCWIDLGESRTHYEKNSFIIFHYWNQQLPNVSGTGNTWVQFLTFKRKISLWQPHLGRVPPSKRHEQDQFFTWQR